MTSDLETNLALMKLRELAPESVEDAREFRGEVTIHIRPDRLITVCELLRDDPGLTFKYLSDLTAVDLYPNEAALQSGVKADGRPPQTGVRWGKGPPLLSRKGI